MGIQKRVKMIKVLFHENDNIMINQNDNIPNKPDSQIFNAVYKR